MNISEALFETKNGCEVARSTWRHMRLVYHHPVKSNQMHRQRMIYVKECFMIKTDDGRLKRWYPIPEDLVATDYFIVEGTPMKYLRSKILKALI